MVKKAITQFKKSKADINTIQFTDHLINGTHRLNVVLATTLNTMFTHGYCPTNLLSSTIIIPIPKNKQNSFNDTDNYIAMSSIICKAIDITIRDTQHDMIKTNDLQFGFKQNSSTVMCNFVMEEVINYNVHNKSNVYIVFLDVRLLIESIMSNDLNLC